jgi:hypothetical protein
MVRGGILEFPPLAINGKTVTEIQEKVNAFADTLEQIFTTNSDADRSFTVSTEQSFGTLPYNHFARTTQKTLPL